VILVNLIGEMKRSRAADRSARHYEKHKEARRADARERARIRYATDPVGVLEQQASIRAKSPQLYVEIHRRASRKWDRTNPGSKKARHLRLKFELTVVGFLSLLWHQQERCAICRGVLGTGSATHVDHDHATGVVRGVLCRMCNVALGHVREDRVVLVRMIRYLDGDACR